MTGLSVLHDSSLSVGKVSTTVKGRFTPGAALGLLVSGTGLDVRYTASDAFILVPGPQGSAEPAATTTTRDATTPAQHRFYGGVQAGIEAAFCEDPITSPGSYRIALQLWIDPDGRLQRLQQLDSTGDPARDRRIAAHLQGLRFNPPPPEVKQPVTILVLPKSIGASGDCGGSAMPGRGLPKKAPPA